MEFGVSTPPSPLAIGLLLPPEETEAVSLRQGAQLAVERANRASSAQVRLLVRGRVGQWGTDGEEAGRLVLDDGARGLIAPPGGIPTHLALQVAGRTATPVVSLCPDTSVTAAGIPWMVRLVPSSREEAGLVFSAAKALNSTGHSPPATRPVPVAFPTRWTALVPEARAGREASRDLRQAAAANSCLLNDPVVVSSKLADIRELGKPLPARSDGILLWLDPFVAGRLAKSLRAAGFAGTLAGPSRLQSAVFVSEAGQAAEGFFVPGPVRDLPSRGVWSGFVVDYQRNFGLEPDLTAAMAYDAVSVLIRVLQRAGPVCRAFPLTGQWSGASGHLQFNQQGDRIVPLELLEYRNGRFRAVAETLTPL